MKLIDRTQVLQSAALALAALTCAIAPTAPAWAQTSNATSALIQKVVRVRGTLRSVDQASLVIEQPNGKTLSLARSPKMTVQEVYPIELADIEQGSFVGTTGMPQPDGTQKALEVHVFPPSARGTGEGHYAWDLRPGSTMTNASVASLAPAPASFEGGRTLRLRYAGGEQTVIVPPGVPIVTFKPADDALLVPGAKVLAFAEERNGMPIATSVQAGRNGFAPPY
ncbi:MAG: hypothetical protein ABI589_15445 [Burkholderiales bacterium]